MATLELLCRTKDAQLDAASVQLVVNRLSWSKTEPGGASDVFRTKSGSYTVTAPNLVYLEDANGATVGEFKNLVPGSATKGQKGLGLAHETARPLDWEVI